MSAVDQGEELTSSTYLPYNPYDGSASKVNLHLEFPALSQKNASTGLKAQTLKNELEIKLPLFHVKSLQSK